MRVAAAESSSAATRANGVGAPPPQLGASSSSSAKHHHPYAKVKKKTKKVEHPYATVKKSPSSGSAATAPSSSFSANKRDTSDEDDDDDADDDDPNEAHLLRPGGGGGGGGGLGSRSGSGRSGSHHLLGADELNTSAHSVIGSRQATPLPPEPTAGTAATNESNLLPPPPPRGEPQPNLQQQQHFSGDSQDSSKGYTSITVREPVRHILLPSARPQTTYATLSETSDDMYAAIEDPTYIPTGTSQSNSDTYAVIDLPPDETDGGGVKSRTAVSMNPGESSYQHHTYSKVDKSKKSKAQALPLPPPPERRHSSRLEDMYAKVQKRLPSPMSPGEQELHDGMPMGASAITQSHEALLHAAGGGGGAGAASAHSGSRLGGGGGGGARPKVRSAEWGSAAAVSIGDSSSSSNPLKEQQRKQPKSEINYSDYEVSLYDKEKRIAGSGGAKVRKDSLAEGGYETLPDPLPSKASDPAYETVPDLLLRRGEATWKKPSYDSGDGGYETVPNMVSGHHNAADEDYWRSNASSGGGGYETVQDSRAGNRDPGYEVLGNGGTAGVAAEQYASWGRKRRDPGYESVGPSSSKNRVSQDKISKAKKEPPYAKLQGLKDENDVDSEVGYETIPGGGGRRQRTNSEYDPAYEELVSKPSLLPSPPPLTAAAMVAPSLPRTGGGGGGSSFQSSSQTASSSTPQQPSSLIHMSVQESVKDVPATPGFQRRSSLVVIEHVEVSDVESVGGAGNGQTPEVNTHIFV
jgi:hypothetical protein